MNNQEFIPKTREIEIHPNIVYRPIKSWHSMTYAGEGLVNRPGIADRSGCLINEFDFLCHKPKTVTHRLYWNKNNPENQISAFLSYPNGLGNCDDYFWELLFDDAERFNSEEELELRIIEIFNVA